MAEQGFCDLVDAFLVAEAVPLAVRLDLAGQAGGGVEQRHGADVPAAGQFGRGAAAAFKAVKDATKLGR